MENKIVFTPTEPNRNLLWLHRIEGSLELQKYGPKGWETINSMGKKEIILFDGMLAPTITITDLLRDSSKKNSIIFINGISNNSHTVGFKYGLKFLCFNDNLSEESWTFLTPEEGELYLQKQKQNETVYFWNGTDLINLHSRINSRLTTFDNALFIMDIGTITDMRDLSSMISKNKLSTIYSIVTNANNLYRLASFKFKYGSNDYWTMLLDPDYTTGIFKILFKGYLQTYRISYSNNTYLLEKLEEIDTSVATPYKYYLNAGGTLSEAEFKTKFVDLIK